GVSCPLWGLGSTAGKGRPRRTRLPAQELTMRGISLVLVAVIASSFAVPQGANRAAAAGLEPGDIVVADQGVPAIIRVDPTTGARTILSSGALRPPPRAVD